MRLLVVGAGSTGGYFGNEGRRAQAAMVGTVATAVPVFVLPAPSCSSPTCAVSQAGVSTECRIMWKLLAVLIVCATVLFLIVPVAITLPMAVSDQTVLGLPAGHFTCRWFRNWPPTGGEAIGSSACWGCYRRLSPW